MKLEFIDRFLNYTNLLGLDCQAVTCIRFGLDCQGVTYIRFGLD
jgi:hypothetical protein